MLDPNKHGDTDYWNGVPRFAGIETWVDISGLSRSGTYVLIGEGKLKAVKAGKRTLIDVWHGLKFMQTLPAAHIRMGKPQKASEGISAT